MEPCSRFLAIIRSAFFAATTLLATQASGQQANRFPEEIEKYPEVLIQVVKGQTTKDDEEFLKTFSEYWLADSLGLSPEQKLQCIAISNGLMQKTLSITQHFITFARILFEHKSNLKLQQEFRSWANGVALLTQQQDVSISLISQFLNNSLALFTRNAFFLNPAFEWRSSNSNFRVQLDSTITIRFDAIDLICTNGSDTLAILSTSGVYAPTRNLWQGKGGRVTWIRSNIPEDVAFATLRNYNIDLTRNDYQADSVWFTNRDYFREPVLGMLKDKLVNSNRPENIYFPEFHTYSKRHKIINFFRDVDFDGGYYMMGGQLIGVGTRDNPARIEIKRQAKEFLRIEALTFIFRRGTIVSDFASVMMRFDRDSMYHSGLGFNYSDQQRRVTLNPTDLLSTQSPMLSSFHNIAITFNQVSWNIDEDELVFGPQAGAAQGRAIFESNNFFNEGGFDRIMGLDEQHPLFAIANYTRRIKSRTFDAEGFSKFVRKSLEHTRMQLLRMSMLGYITYDSESQIAHALPKLFDAIRARGQLIDYDVIRFSSLSANQNPNARLNLNTLDMSVFGVSNVSVSDSQNVSIMPARQELILRNNRNFTFDGTVKAGLFTFQGEGFDFNYQDFTFELSAIRTMHINYQTDDYDMEGRKVLMNVLSNLEDVTGKVYIDKPDNKSGLKKNPDYPIFKSTKNSFVYYDSKSIHNGIYTRDKFYFEIYPFEFKNINNFRSEDIKFVGEFHSADIFSPMEDTLTLRPDNSLGFRRNLPPSGLAIYQGKGRFYNRIDLSNMGLRGNGRIAYITSTTTSDDFYFFPRSMSTQSIDFTIREQLAGIQYPDVKAKVHGINWLPYADSLSAHQGVEPFSMYSDQTKLTGNLVLTPLGLTGDGRVDLTNGHLVSKGWEFNRHTFSADTASLQLNVPHTETIALQTSKLGANVDMEARRGEFTKLGESIHAELNAMMYHSHMDGFTWGMDSNELTMATTGRQAAMAAGRFHVRGMVDRDTFPAGSLFYSVHGQEDSLYFLSPKVRYHMAQPTLRADSVRYIVVADAIIHPHKQRIEIEARERMRPMKESVIVANHTNKHHRFYDAEVSVISRWEYRANGMIDYVDLNGDAQPVMLKEIKVDRQLRETHAQAVVTAPDSFTLSPRFGFIGTLNIRAPEKNWHFSGGANTIHPCPQIVSQWVTFSSTIDPARVLIPMPERPININNVFLMSGSVISSDTLRLYPGLLTRRKDYADRSLVSSQGFMEFNPRNNRFQIGSLEKLNNPDTTGNLIGLSSDLCMIFSEGTVSLPVRLGQLKENVFGNLTHRLEDSTLTMDLVLSLDFFLCEVALQTMALDIKRLENLEPTDLNRKAFRNSLSQRCSPAEAADAKNQILLFGNLTQTPKGLDNTITFYEVKMRWDPSNGSFVSEGRLGIGSIGGVLINKRINGFIEIIKRGSGDWLMMYLELSPGEYYSFYYNRGSMQVSSHNPAFNDPINLLKPRARRIRVSPGEIPYNFVLGTRRELTRVRTRYAELIGTSPEELEKAAEAKPPAAQVPEPAVESGAGVEPAFGGEGSPEGQQNNPTGEGNSNTGGGTP